MTEIDIPLSVASQLRYYVYLLVDPRTRRAFYVGKGFRRRVLDHFGDQQRSRKTAIIRALKRRGMSPSLEILTHGLADEATAYRIESAAIDLLSRDTLTNKVRGQHSRVFGRMTLRQVIGKYAEPVKIGHPAILIRINQRYRHGISEQELYEATRGVWKVGARRATVRYAMAVYEGVVREVYEIAAWHSAGSTSYRTRTRADVLARGRWEFTGTKAGPSVRRQYLDRSVETYLPSGSQNPIAYPKVRSRRANKPLQRTAQRP
jgi:hypothetical protein